VVVTPSRLSQSIDDALPATSIITRADIERWQAVDLVSVLSRSTGVEFAQAGGRGAQASLFVRGANSSQVLVLVDGVRLNSVNGGAAAVGGIALDTVDRIEIARGNLSSLYGSAAIGGVVQIFTRKGAPGFTAVLEGGQGDTLNGNLSAGINLDRISLGGAIGGAKTESFSAIDPKYGVPAGSPPIANPDIDGNRNTSASLSASYRSEGGTLASLSAWANRNTTDFDNSFDAASVTHSEQSRLGGINALVRTNPTESWESQVTIGATRDRTENEVSDPASFDNGSFESSNLQVSWSNEIKLGELVKALAGLEYLKQKGESTSYDLTFSGTSTQFERSVGSAWVGLVGRFGPHQLQANARYDDYSDVGGATSGLLAYGYVFAPDWRVTAQISNAFRAPSFNDLYFPSFGNPDLKPEKSSSGELGLQYASDSVSLRAALYRTDTRDLIVFDPTTSQAQNLDNARVTGFELGSSWRTGGWTLSANGMLLRAIDEQTDERLLRRAPWIINAAVAYDAASWNAGLEVSVVGPRDDLDLLTFQRIELASYTLARLVGGWRVTRQLLLRARIENLFDAKYETVSGYNVMPRTAIVGVEFRY
jgi:vitamin B12 transporter